MLIHPVCGTVCALPISAAAVQVFGCDLDKLLLRGDRCGRGSRASGNGFRLCASQLCVRVGPLWVVVYAQRVSLAVEGSRPLRPPYPTATSNRPAGACSTTHHTKPQDLAWRRWRLLRWIGNGIQEGRKVAHSGCIFTHRVFSQHTQDLTCGRSRPRTPWYLGVFSVI